MVLIKNSRVIVTGGAQGLGLEFCHDLLVNGARAIAIFDIDIKSGEDSVKILNLLYGKDKVIFVPTDVSDIEQFERNFKFAVNQLGGLDIMINNAGIMNDSEWSLACDINVKGVIQGTLMAIDVMGKHKGGKGGAVINMGSVAAFNSGKFLPIYCTTKAAIVHFTRCIANSYDEIGVEAKAMCPSATETGLLNKSGNKFLNIFDQAKLQYWIMAQPTQKADVVSKSVMRLIEEAPNGAIWSQLRDKPLCKIVFPKLPDLAKPLQNS